jgi:hypothetical protein
MDTDDTDRNTDPRQWNSSKHVSSRSRWDRWMERGGVRNAKRAAQSGPFLYRIQFDDFCSYFLGVSTGVATLSITEDEPCMLVR